MASKDQEKKEEAKDQKTKKSKAPKKGAASKKEAKSSKTSKKSKSEKGGGSDKKEKPTVQSTGHSWGSQTPPISGPGKRTVKVDKVLTNKSRSGGSEENFLTSLGRNKNYLWGLAGAVAGGALLFRGAKGNWPFSKKNAGVVDLHSKVTVDKSREELYAYWRNLENLPNFMTHLDTVKELDNKRSRWTAAIPGGLGTIEWEAEIEEERENEHLSWRSLPGAEVENSGEVRFEDAPGGGGTVVSTTISYRPPAGQVGGYAAKILNPTFEKTVKRDLAQFKKHMEKEDLQKQRSKPEGRILY